MSDILGWGHLAAALVALASGAAVLAIKKGTALHRRVGWTYVVSILLVNGSAFLIYDLFGRFGPFHFAAAFSLASVLMGIVPARRRRPKGRWLRIHAYWMTGSYVGLVAAAVAETSTRYLDYDFGTTVIIATVAVSAAGVTAIRAWVPSAIRGLARGAG